MTRLATSDLAVMSPTELLSKKAPSTIMEQLSGRRQRCCHGWDVVYSLTPTEYDTSLGL